jgi:hypothetical protein
MGSLRESFQSVRKKKEDMREDLLGTKEDLFSFRPRPLQNFVRSRMNRLRKSVERQRSLFQQRERGETQL